MTDIVNYKKISDLEEITEVTEGATVPVLDGDGKMKRISAAGIGSGSSGGGSAAPVVFKVSNGFLTHYDNANVWATTEEVVDAYFAGNAYIYAAYGDDYAPQKVIGFYISSASVHAQTKNSNPPGFCISGASNDFTTVISKYLP